MSRALSSGQPTTVMRLPRPPSTGATRTSAPKWRSMRSVWSRVASGSITVVSPAVLRPASRMQLFTCAEATGSVYSIGTISSVPTTASGMRPPSRASKRAPMRLSGSITRCIGRLRSEASPVMKEVKRWLARMPVKSRAAVPELPRSSTSAGSLPGGVSG